MAMKQGDRGEHIERLQQSLTQLGYVVAADGIFGPLTNDALEEFAQDNGYIGVDTLALVGYVLEQTETLPEIDDVLGSRPPKYHGVPFSLITHGAKCWPVITDHENAHVVSYVDDIRRNVGNRARAFMSKRNHGKRFHVGVDLYCNEGDPVISVENGKVLNHYTFVKGTRSDGSTYAVAALFVQNDSGSVINYGEVEDRSWTYLGVEPGSKVGAGQQIAYVGKMRVSSMLHFEMYTRGTMYNQRYYVRRNPPPQLYDPTLYLLELKRRIFDDKI